MFLRTYNNILYGYNGLHTEFVIIKIVYNYLKLVISLVQENQAMEIIRKVKRGNKPPVLAVEVERKRKLNWEKSGGYGIKGCCNGSWSI